MISRFSILGLALLSGFAMAHDDDEGFLTPDGRGGWILDRYRGPPSYITPDRSGGYISDRQDKPPLYITPDYSGGYGLTRGK